jgi:Tol biopolymer transport system component/imidazolonepropionase-like amidohydrolase
VCAFLALLVPVLSAQAPAPAAKAAAPAPPKDAAADINVPRPDARKVAFDVSEGTWMSVDVSPDGTTIAFDLLGDLYTMPIGGGTATGITRGPAYDYHPRFSPDGASIAFTSDENGMENLWLVDRDGRNRRELTAEKTAVIRSAAWMPDGAFLVARKEDTSKAGLPPTELWLFHRYGGSGVKVTAADEINGASGPVASRDGRYLYFAARPGRFSYTADVASGIWQVVRYDRRTGESVKITSGMGGGARPQVSPDGRTLVFVSRRDADTVLVARDLASGRERVLVEALGRDDQEGFAALDVYPGYAFVPDGSAVVVWSRGTIWRVPVAGGSPQPIPFTAHVEQWLAPAVTIQEKVAQGDVAARILRWPSQSPDGKWIAFDAFGRVWLQAIENGKASGAPRRLTPDDTLAPREYAPAFSPDGRWVAYVTWGDRDGGFVWKAPVPGTGASTPQKLTEASGHYANPSWAPGSDRLAVIRGSGLEFRGRQPEDEEFFEICWLPAGGGAPEVVTTVSATYTLRFHPQAAWNRDGTRLFYRREVEGLKPREGPKFDLVSIRLDGTDRTPHLRFPAIADVVVSPDERWVAFSSRDNVYVTALPPAQVKDVPEVGMKEGSVPVWRLSADAGGFVGWADEGRTVTWGRANVVHRLPVAAAIAFVEKQKADAIAKRKQQAAAGGDAQASAAAAAAAGKAAAAEPKVPSSEQVAIALAMPRPAPTGDIVFTGARVVTMRGDEILPAADVVVSGHRISAVGPSGQVAIPAGAKRYDATGTTIVPGLIDTHAHLHYSALETFPELKWEYAANLAYGVTTVYDPSAPSLDVFAQGEMVEAGLMLGPRIYSSGDVLYGGQTAAQFAEVNDQDDARRQVRRMKAYGARMIKVYQQPRRDQRLWFAQACREEKLLLTVEGAGELHTDMTTVLDGYTAFEHALPYALYQDVVQLLAKSETYYTPTLLVAYGGPTAEFYFWQTENPHGDERLNRFTPHRALDAFGRRHTWISPDEYHFPVVARGAADVVRAGGRVALGAHGQLQGLGVHWELWAHAGVGGRAEAPALTPHQAWRAATSEAARKIGFSADLGTIEGGKLADFLVLGADPLADIRNSTAIKWVVKNGEVYDAATLRQDWPSSKELPEFFWRQ